MPPACSIGTPLAAAAALLKMPCCCSALRVAGLASCGSCGSCVDANASSVSSRRNNSTAVFGRSSVRSHSPSSTGQVQRLARETCGFARPLATLRHVAPAGGGGGGVTPPETSGPLEGDDDAAEAAWRDAQRRWNKGAAARRREKVRASQPQSLPRAILPLPQPHTPVAICRRPCRRRACVTATVVALASLPPSSRLRHCHRRRACVTATVVAMR